MEKTVNGEFILLPPHPKCCQQCAVEHDPTYPHNQQSLYWQVWFKKEYNRSPTWEDAMAHCTDEMKQFWINELKKYGVNIENNRADN